jgi:hypothetical protein
VLLAWVLASQAHNSTRHGVFFAVGCHEASTSTVWLRTTSCISYIWLIRFQLPRLEHEKVSAGLFLPQICSDSRLVSNGQPSCRLVSELPYRPKVDAFLTYVIEHLAYNCLVLSFPRRAGRCSQAEFLDCPPKEVSNLRLDLEEQPLTRETEGATTPPIRWEGGTTPPVPSSSPGFGSDPMDLSPLPHKVPFSVARVVKEQVTVTTETIDEDMISPCDTTPLPLADKTNTHINE